VTVAEVPPKQLRICSTVKRGIITAGTEGQHVKLASGLSSPDVVTTPATDRLNGHAVSFGVFRIAYAIAPRGHRAVDNFL